MLDKLEAIKASDILDVIVGCTYNNYGAGKHGNIWQKQGSV